jgi:hypothetical protein
MSFATRVRTASLSSNVARSALIAVAAVAVLLTTSVSSRAARLDPLPLGSFQLLTTKPSCISGWTCRGFIVTACQNVQSSITGTIAKAYPPPQVPVRGLVVFFSGTGGTSWWNGGGGLGNTFLAELRQLDGLVTVQVRWDAQWFQASVGEDAGVAHEACRPATAIRWIHDSLYAPLGVVPAPGACGFCITGNSGGASQVTYPLSHYGLESIVDAAIPTSGPTHSRIDKGCLPEYPDYRFEEWSTPAIDRAFGYFDPGSDPGPCVRMDPVMTTRWAEESIVAGALDLSYPTVRIAMVIGGLDNTAAPFQAADYQAALAANPGNHFTKTFVPDMPHSIWQAQSGLDALEVALLGSF